MTAEKSKALAAALAQIEKQFGRPIMRMGDGEATENIRSCPRPLGLDIALGVGGLRAAGGRDLRSGIVR